MGKNKSKKVGGDSPDEKKKDAEDRDKKKEDPNEGQ